jgi:hypothetical protein
MTDKTLTQPTPITENSRRIAYWGATGLLCLGMLAGGSGQLLRASFNVNGMLHLGYPLYVLTIVGFWKLCGVVVLLAPGLPLLKEWAYAGFILLLTSATASHIASGDGVSGWIAPFVFACLAVASWWLRPAERRLTIQRPSAGHAQTSGPTGSVAQVAT